jgi:putative membrane protein
MTRILSFAVLVVLATNAHAQQVQPPPSNVPIGDEAFAMKAYCEGLSEVAKSQLAVRQASQANIREFAEKMVKQHTETNNKIVEMARKKGIPLPNAIDPVSNVVISRLSRLSGSDFDKAYLAGQMCAHKDALHLFGHESRKGEDSELRDFAKQTIPTLQHHTKMAFDLAGEKQEYDKHAKIEKYAKEVFEEK